MRLGWVSLVLWAGATSAQTADLVQSDAISSQDIPSQQWANSFRQQIAACYTVGEIGENVDTGIVRVAFEMSPDARPLSNSIRFAAKSGVAGEEQAYRAAGRAIMRCGASGYDLPADLFSQWNFVEISFSFPIPVSEVRPLVRPDE